MGWRNWSAVSAMAAVAVAVVATAGLSAASAQTYPTKPVRFIIGQAPGGGNDTVGRAIAQGLSELWGQPTIVENKPGANTIVASELVAKSAPDGYTIYVAGDSGLTLNPFMYAKLPYDPRKDFALITRLLRVHQMLVVPASLPANNLKEFVALMKKDGSKYNFGSAGIGDPGHINFSGFQQSAGFKMEHVPYRGLAAALQAVLAGDVHAVISSVLSAEQYIKTGKMKALAISGPVRSRTVPDVPTVIEAGFPDVVFTNFFALVAPAGTPHDILTKIAADTRKVLADPAFRAKYVDPFGYEVLGETPEQFAEAYKKELADAERNVKASGAKLEY